ncbi:MAG: DUF1360 domain-containing protein [Cytobacillus gottheilii]|uniref:DUF1360 domain-containing protein n=2 Tax=Cytobacillus gottheilii TaxID=859144 RepID=A0ABX8FI38_9BACI|nr:DUF1360 domain-containing protein [Cytobacillus gottheilii]QVY63699.1 DUF1360 domain-containing protein [Cytobacillus gottheilii]
MELTWLELFIIVLASFRLTRLLVYDQITQFIRSPFFNEVEEVDEFGQKETYLVPKNRGIRGFFGQLLSCHWCTGVWCSIFICSLFFVYHSIAFPLLLVLAVAGLASIIEVLVQKWLED